MSFKQTTPIQNFFEDRSILITGGLGAVGKVLVEKILRSCPGIKNIYLLIRSKKGVDAEQRLDEFLKLPLYDRLRQESPDAFHKIIIVHGDITEVNLGMSQNDQQIIIENVSIVFHSAATVRFTENLKVAIVTNVIGTRNALRFCQRMNKLQAFIHVSTAFSNCNRESIDEIIYPISHDLEQLIELCESKTERQMEELTSEIIGTHPNTYTFTKAVAECMVESHRGSLPVAIVRPAMVLACFKEPLIGWIDNYYGPTALIVAAGKGLIRTLMCDEKKSMDLIPSDMVVNLMISVAWKTGTSMKRSHSIVPVYNYSTSTTNPITFGEGWDDVIKYLSTYPFNDMIWYPSMRLIPSLYERKIYEFFQETIPGLLLDAIAKFRNSKGMVRHYKKKIDEKTVWSNWFCIREWTFQIENVRSLNESLNLHDRQIFYFDVQQINWSYYMKHYIKGIRQFLLKEHPDTLPSARSRIVKLRRLHGIFKCGLWFTIVSSIVISFLIFGRIISNYFNETSNLC